MKKILLIQAHPNPDSYCVALAKSYAQSAKEGGAEVQEIVISNLKFDPNLAFG